MGCEAGWLTWSWSVSVIGWLADVMCLCGWLVRWCGVSVWLAGVSGRAEQPPCAGPSDRVARAGLALPPHGQSLAASQ